MATNGTFNHQDAYTATSEHSSSTAGAEGNAASRPADDTNTPPDQIGWYFVEQYYTTLSKTPDRLHLYYSKASQFVCGVEAQVAAVTVGRHAIQDRIAGLDFQDTKVRVSNVDSQGSGDHIVIQVIGECSHKAGEPKKFVQTFVLAKQPTGYFVLNDMLRYIDEEAESEHEPEEEVAGQQTVTAGDHHQVAAKSEPAAAAPPAYEEDVAAAQPTSVQLSEVDQKLAKAEAEANTTDTVSAPVSEAPPAAAAETDAQADEPVAQAELPAAANTEPEPEKATPEVTEEAVKQQQQPEVPKEPRPTAAPAPAEPEKPKEPSRPMTWANRAAAAVPRAPVALPKTAPPPTASPVPTKPAAAALVAATAPTQPSSTAQASATSAAAKADKVDKADKADNEWKTAETRRSSRAQPTAAPAEKENRFAYIKNVTDKVQEEDLRRDLEQYGTLDRLEMNTIRSCAFADFSAPPDWGLIAKNGPLVVSGERIIVEPRRPRANPGNYSRGGAASGRGRGGYDRGARNSSQGNGRGGFSGGSIRGGPPRGRANIPVGNA